MEFRLLGPLEVVEGERALALGGRKQRSVLVVRVPQHRAAAGGMDWGDAVIGAGGAVVVLGLTAGGMLALQRRRHVASPRTPAAA